MIAEAACKKSREEHGCKAGFAEVLPREVAQLLQHARHLSTLDDHLGGKSYSILLLHCLGEELLVLGIMVCCIE